ncbi:MAG TPA: hypothetical protein VH186_03975 [Chloroflexia bacterium]|nr:hypothetical protein [Chloroflexia bacterium]
MPQIQNADRGTSQQEANIRGENNSITQINNNSKKKRTSDFAAKLAGLLEEANFSGIQRLIEIFGAELVGQKVEEALVFYNNAAAKGIEAYNEPDTAVATGKSKPRTRGGVFFFLMREYCSTLGLNWGGLRISPAWYDQKGKKQSTSLNGTPSSHKANFSDTETQSDVTVEQQKDGDSEKAVALISSNTKNSANKNSSSFQDAKSVADQKEPLNPSLSKPARVKVTVIGSLSGTPKLNPQAREGLLELPFKAEMGNSLPKGLPNLGESKVVVWCSAKQFEKITQQTTITRETRFLIEGEPIPAVGTDLSPFLRVICTRLTTLELEQLRQKERNAANQ